MNTPSELNQIVLPQNVVGPLTRSAIFLVLCIRQNENAYKRMREFCAGLSGLIRAVEFRDVEAGLTCVAGFGSDAWDKLFGVPRPAAPGDPQPVIRRSRDTGERELVMMRWGIVPWFAKSELEFKKLSTINAKSDRLTDSKMWREPFAKRRCLVPASGLYEWVRPESRPDDCPAWSHDRTCRPIGSTLGGQAGW